MSGNNRSKLEQRVVTAADAALAQQQFVAPVDVFLRMGWLQPSAVDRWRQGQVDSLEGVTQVNLSKLSSALAVLRRWATDRHLMPSETTYVARTRDRRQLQFSRSGSLDIERAYRTHWVSPALSDAKRERLAEKQSRAPDLVVILPLNDWTCTECGGTGDLLLMEGPGPLCMGCADLAHLVFLPSGDAALTRRAKRASGLSAVVVRFSRTRKRYERQGILVEEDALVQAEEHCLADEDARRRRREREESRRAEEDLEFHAAFARAITETFPGCPRGRAEAIARHAGERRSGRVGRSAAGRAFEVDAVTLAVAASVRHTDTVYDELLMSGVSRRDAREQVASRVQQVLEQWRGQSPSATVRVTHPGGT